MIVYHYDEKTGVYSNLSSNAPPDPMVKGSFLVPANATPLIPPNVGNPRTQQAVFRDGKWEIEYIPEKVVSPADNIKNAPTGLVKGPFISDVLMQENVERG